LPGGIGGMWLLMLYSLGLALARMLK
jgi:hypothetical protein